jgi:hypothetical protein
MRITKREHLCYLDNGESICENEMIAREQVKAARELLGWTMIGSANSCYDVGGSAFAADLPTAKPAPAFVPPPIFSWTGFYAGLNAGAAWNNHGNVTIFDPTIPATRVFGVGGTVAFIGGGQLGYNFQTAPSCGALRPTFKA